MGDWCLRGGLCAPRSTKGDQHVLDRHLALYNLLDDHFLDHRHLLDDLAQRLDGYLHLDHLLDLDDLLHLDRLLDDTVDVLDHLHLGRVRGQG